MKFSVLMSVYKKENPLFLIEALDSVINQTLQPNEIVLVKDGPLTEKLDQVINDYKKKYSNLFNIICLETNQGLGIALQKGVLSCNYELIARMDTDDIARQDRFEKQINYLKNNPDIDILGSSITEFDNNPDQILSKRIVPTSHISILKFAQQRNPMNHQTVIYRKQCVLKAGNYKDFLWFEDYYLWGRMLSKNFKFANIDEMLVNVRAGKSMLARRKGLKYLKQEILLQKTFLDINFISVNIFIKNITFKSLLRLSNDTIRNFIYSNFLRA